MVEELAEQREPGIERRRQADVRGDVGDLDVVAVHREAERLEGRIADPAGGFQIGEREGVRRRRGVQGVERRLFRGAGRGGFVAVAESICRGLGILHHHAGLILGVERGLEGVVDGLHQGDVGQAGLDHPAGLQALQDRRRIAQRLIDDQVGNGAQARIEHHRTRVVRRIVARTTSARRARPAGAKFPGTFSPA